jgi:hypothetical protein
MRGVHCYRGRATCSYHLMLALPCTQVIKEARNRLAAQYGPKAVAFEFAQVGGNINSLPLQYVVLLACSMLLDCFVP